MADLNTTYSGTVDQQDPDVVIGEIPGFWPWDRPRPIYLPEGLREKIRKGNADAVTTTDAVKVAYLGVTPTERVAWINERISAINERVKFIKNRTDELLSRLQAMSSDSYNTLVGLVTKALSLVPVVGTAVTSIQNSANTAQTLEQYKVQSLIQDYASDLQQLATIRNQLLSELAKANTTDPTNEAPKVSTWYYVVGIVLLLLFFVWYRRRNKKRRKR